MTPETFAQLLEYFDIKQFFADNSPLHLAILLGIMILLWIAAYFLTVFFQKKLEELVAKTSPVPSSPKESVKSLIKMDFELFEKVIKSSRLLLYLAIFYWGLSRITIGPIYMNIIKVLFSALCIWAAIEFLVAFVPFNIDLYLRRRGTTLSTSNTRSLMPIIKGIIWAIGLTFLMDNLGFHVSTIIAGLGIVGVAVGLAGQAILADFFSYIVILMDKPFRIGDYVELSDGRAGDVEYMGPKTTHLRNMDDDLIVCANAEMTKGMLLNQGDHHKRVVILNLGVSYATPVEVLKRLPDILMDVVDSFPDCEFDRACLTDFGDSNLNIQLIYFVLNKSQDIRGYMMIRSNVNIMILDRFNKEGISIDYPTRHVFLTESQQPAGAAKKAESNAA